MFEAVAGPVEGLQRQWVAGEAEFLDADGKELGIELPAWGGYCSAVTQRGGTVVLAQEVCRRNRAALLDWGIRPGYQVRIGKIQVKIRPEWLPFDGN